MDRYATVTYPETLAAEASYSPFASGIRPMGSLEIADSGHAESPFAGLVSTPFSDGLLDGGRSEPEAAYGELADEGFDEAVQALVDEAAGRHLASCIAYEARLGSTTSPAA